ncbi:hypothetical protein AHF37_11225 [Paragonimus kellicotti]|nr:hypothetical protein AHF37_11225 [Paragonimus kellicotti]
MYIASLLYNLTVTLVPVIVQPGFILFTALFSQHPSPIWLNCMTSLFIWCQACRHGGHASHLADWFHAGSTTEGDPSNTCARSAVSSESVSEGEEEEEDEEADEESDEDRIGFDDIILQGTYDTGPITQEANPISTNPLCFAHDRSVNDFQRY